MKFTSLSGPDKENEPINEESTLTIIDSYTLLDTKIDKCLILCAIINVYYHH